MFYIILTIINTLIFLIFVSFYIYSTFVLNKNLKYVKKEVIPNMEKEIKDGMKSIKLVSKNVNEFYNLVKGNLKDDQK